MEIRPQPRDRQGQHHLRKILGHDNALPLPGGRYVGHAQIGGHRPRGFADLLPLSLSGHGASARKIRSAAPAPAPGRGPAAQNRRPGLRHLLRPRAHFAVQQGRLWQPRHHPPRQRAGDLLRTPLGAHGGTRTMGRGGTDHRSGRLDGTFDGAPSPFRDPLLRAVVRPRASDRLQERHAEPRDVPAEKVVLQHLLQRRAGFRRRNRQRGAGQEGSRQESGHEIL